MKGRRTGALFRKSKSLEEGCLRQCREGKPSKKEQLACMPIEFQEFHAMRELIELDLYPQISGILLADWEEKYPQEAEWKRFLWKELGISTTSASSLILHGEELSEESLCERMRWINYAIGFLTDAVARKVYRRLGLWGSRTKSA